MMSYIVEKTSTTVRYHELPINPTRISRHSSTASTGDRRLPFQLNCKLVLYSRSATGLSTSTIAFGIIVLD